jgi:TPR repeat protein
MILVSRCNPDTWYSRGLTRFLLLVCLAVSPVLASADAEEYLDLGNQAHREGDIRAAMSWFRKAAEQGHATAQLQLARILDIADENEEAAKWYQRAAAQGNAEAEFELGKLYAAGIGVSKDLKQAVQAYQRAAQQGHANAIRVLAAAFEHGRLGLPIDHEQAVFWLHRGVTHQDRWSMQRLATAYQNGELGLPVDPVRARDVEAGQILPWAGNVNLKYDDLRKTLVK